MENFTRKLLTEWRRLKLPVADKCFIIAVSGGADSVGLMLALDELRKLGKLNLRFIVAHFNHNLRGENSAADEEFVRHLTIKLNLEFACETRKPEDEIRNKKGNLEQNARQSRYDFLLETAENLRADSVLTAHTINDQAETFLLNLMRGSGLDGLSGMKLIRNFEPQVSNPELEKQSAIHNQQSIIRLVRPLLNWAKREDTENFCRFKNVKFRFDAMNEDLAFSRVRIRKVLLPLLKDFNPKIVETLAQTASLLRETAEHLEFINQKPQAETLFELHSESDNNENRKPNLLLKDLTNVFPAMRRIILRDWLKANRGNLRRLDLKHIEAVENLIFSRKSGRIVELPGGEIIVKNGGKLHFQKTKVEK